MVALAGGRVRVIAGPWTGADGAETRGPADTFTPLAVWDVKLDPGADFHGRLPAGWSAMVAVLSGSVDLAGRSLEATRTIVLGRDGDAIDLVAGRTGATFLVLAGEPIDEPIAAHGPFVMNTRDEIRAAIADYQSGRMGRLDPR